MSFTPNAERHQPRWVKGEVGEFEADLVQALRPVLRQHEQLLPDRRPWCMCGHRAETPGSREQHLLEVVATAVVAALNLPERDRETADLRAEVERWRKDWQGALDDARRYKSALDALVADLRAVLDKHTPAASPVDDKAGER